jgi:rhamnosyltransferase
MKKIAAIVVLYNPNTKETIKNIHSYAPYLDELIIIDNSSIENIEIKNTLEERYKVSYIFNNANLGIATALNIGCQKAIELGCLWTLTMDQDSKFINFQFYKTSFLPFYNKNSIAIVSASAICLTDYTYSLSKFFSEDFLKLKAKETLINYALESSNANYVETDFVITSGSFLNLSLFEKINKFDDKLFIDEVDYDYCARALLLNLKILNFENIKFFHELGYYKDGIPQHNYIRKYYMTRNLLYMSKKYGKQFSKYSRKNTMKFIRKRFSYAWKKEEDSSRKIKSMLLGIFDFYTNNYNRKFITNHTLNP